MIFVDTSVVVAASTPADPRSEACRKLLTGTDRAKLACASHSLAEIYAILSGRPRPFKLPPADAAKIVSHLRKSATVITLTAGEYLEAIDRLVELGHSAGMIYDALLMACARKAAAKRIYTLNVKDFRQAAPDLSERILTP